MYEILHLIGCLTHTLDPSSANKIVFHTLPSSGSYL